MLWHGPAGLVSAGREHVMVTSRGVVEVGPAVRVSVRGVYAGISWAGVTSLVVAVSRAMEPSER
jgi:hypothetical protein